MVTFTTLLGILIMFAALLVPGYIMGKLNLIYDSAITCFCNLLMYVAMPSLVFSKLITLEAELVSPCGLAVSVLLPIALAAALLAVCRVFCRDDSAASRAMKFCAIFPNCGFLGIPLAAAIWPNTPQIVLYISIFNLVSTFLLLTLGVYILSGDKNEIRLKKTLVSPIFIAIVLGTAGAFCKISVSFGAIAEYAETLSRLTTPLSMTVLGFELSKLNLLKMWKNSGIFAVSLVKLVVSPLIALAILLLCKAVGVDIQPELAYSMLISSAVSTAASGPSMAKKYNSDSEYAAALTLGNTLLCVVLLPIMYLVYSLIFG